jgi:hypothetical protein
VQAAPPIARAGSATSVYECVFTVTDDADNTVKAAAAVEAISYQQKRCATMVMLGIWQDNCNIDQPGQILLVKKVLYYIC